MFAISVDGMLRKEAIVILTNLIGLIATKFEKPLSQVHGWVNVRIVIGFMRPYYRMIRRSLLPSPLQYQ